MRSIKLVALAVWYLGFVNALPSRDQLVLSPEQDDTSEWITFPKIIRKVAVIGAGPSGLQSASALEREGFEVRLFERADAPGGIWYHNKLTPARESYPDAPLDIAGFKPDPRSRATEYYVDGDDGLSLEERWREHSRPSPVWDDLTSNSSPDFTTLPDTSYPRDAAWELSARLIQRSVRTFASLRGLNVNDLPANSSAPAIVSYSTRVELLEKEGNNWKLSLKRVQRLPDDDRLRVDWWEEHFDAVVVATGGYDVAHVPDVKGLVQWSKVHDGKHFPVIHSQHYRNASGYHNKTVLIVGASVSASEISRNLTPHAGKVYIAIRNTTRDTYMARRSIRRIHPDAEIIPEIVEFDRPASDQELRGSSVKLANGSALSGIDEVILATGYQRSNPFLRNYFKEGGEGSPHASVSPILTDGHTLNSLSWTGHYIPDPTLAFTNVRPWTHGRYQSVAFARVWKGTARLPNKQKLWKEYYEDNHWQGKARVVFGSLEEEALTRQYVTWLNSEALINGGRLVEQWPTELRERFSYYADQAWEHGYISSANFTEHENTPRADWPVYDRPQARDAPLDHLESQSEW